MRIKDRKKKAGEAKALRPERGLSSFTYDLLEREDETELQRQRREVRRKKLESRTRAVDPAKEKRASARRRTLLVMLLVVAAAAVFVLRSVQQMYILGKERDAVSAELDSLTKQQKELRAELDMVNTDEYVEEMARSLLHMTRPSEILYIVPNNTEYSKPDEEGDEPSEQPGEGAKP